jgi:predicted amidophosphoribosyltransferase
VVICASCGSENRDEARFCDSCAAPLVAAAVQRAVGLYEQKGNLVSAAAAAAFLEELRAASSPT